MRLSGPIAAALLLSAATARAELPRTEACLGVGSDVHVCENGKGRGWYFDKRTMDMHLLVRGVDWLEIDPDLTNNQLLILSPAVDTLAFAANGVLAAALSVTGAVTIGTTLGVTGDATFSGALNLVGDLTLAGGSGALVVNGTTDLGPWFEVSFTEGAAKGLGLTAADGSAYVTTADAGNALAYGEHNRFSFITNTTATGTITPAGTALGLDLNAGSPGNSDEWTLTAGQGFATGGMIIPGTTVAWEACVTADLTDVSEVAGFWLLVTSAGAPADLSSADPNYTSYAGIGVEQTDIVVSDDTDGAVDTDVDAVDLTPVELCIRGSGAGAITYYIDGTNTAAAATHTLGDGVPHVVRIQGLNHTGTEAPMNVSAFSLLPQ